MNVILSSFSGAAGGQLYMWGRVKTTGENWMYPKPVLDLRLDSYDISQFSIVFFIMNYVGV